MILSNNYIMALIVLLSIILLYISFILLLVVIIENKKFNKRINVKEYIKNIDYTNYKDLKRDNYSFNSSNNKLNGYKYYCDNTSNKIMIFVNGYNTTTQNYISEINFFASLGYIVYCFDNTGTGQSEGKKFGGVPQAIIDLKYCLEEVVKQHPNNKITIVGHSMGGYAASNIINVLDINVVNKIIAISPFNNIVDVVYDNIKKNLGKNLFLYKTMHKIYLKIKYKKYASFNTFDTLKYTNIKTLIIHGEEDKTVKVDNCVNSMMSNTNMFVKYLVLENKGHLPMLSNNAINYNLYLKHNISDLQIKYNKNIPENELEKLNKNIDYNLKYQFDEEVLDVLKQFLKEE